MDTPETKALRQAMARIRGVETALTMYGMHHIEMDAAYREQLKRELDAVAKLIDEV